VPLPANRMAVAVKQRKGVCSVISLEQFFRDDQGQDLIEYTLLMAFVSLASAALFTSAGGSINTVFSVANTLFSKAASLASGGT
jgi:Flp pilus assembly pilin Flp